MSEHHWSRARAEANVEALDFLRSRNDSPGVEGGGTERNFWCMECGGVIPYDAAHERCPHCSADLGGDAKRYFNWVEIDRPVEGEFKSVWPLLIGGLVAFGALVWLVFRVVLG